MKLAFVVLILFACSLAAVLGPCFPGRESLRHGTGKGSPAPSPAPSAAPAPN